MPILPGVHRISKFCGSANLAEPALALLLKERC
nr:MAG TPA_asm: hypothetical protein [Caudoviricetes sp.]